MIHDHVTTVVPKVTADLDKNTLVIDFIVSLVTAAIQSACPIVLTLILFVSHTSVFSTTGVDIDMMVKLASLKQEGVFAAIPSISKTLNTISL